MFWCSVCSFCLFLSCNWILFDSILINKLETAQFCAAGVKCFPLCMQCSISLIKCNGLLSDTPNLLRIVIADKTLPATPYFPSDNYLMKSKLITTPQKLIRQFGVGTEFLSIDRKCKMVTIKRRLITSTLQTGQGCQYYNINIAKST